MLQSFNTCFKYNQFTESLQISHIFFFTQFDFHLSLPDLLLLLFNSYQTQSLYMKKLNNKNYSNNI